MPVVILKLHIFRHQEPPFHFHCHWHPQYNRAIFLRQKLSCFVLKWLVLLHSHHVRSLLLQLSPLENIGEDNYYIFMNSSYLSADMISLVSVFKHFYLTQYTDHGICLKGGYFKFKDHGSLCCQCNFLLGCEIYEET